MSGKPKSAASSAGDAFCDREHAGELDRGRARLPRAAMQGPSCVLKMSLFLQHVDDRVGPAGAPGNLPIDEWLKIHGSKSSALFISASV